jgi:hypothetical protein
MVAMAGSANPSDEVVAAEALARHAAALLAAVDAAVAAWAARCVVDRWSQWTGLRQTAEVEQAAREAGERARAEVVPALGALLATDVDEQRTNPLSIIRASVRHPTEALRQLGVPGVVRDEHAERIFPDDDYDLSPASFADLDPSVHEPGLVWGAANAHVVLARRPRRR